MTLVDRSPDLSRLLEEGYDIEIRDSNLLMHHVPYVTSTGSVDFCTLVSEITTNGEQTIKPGRHEVWVVGDIPHDHRGHKISILVDEKRVDYGEGLSASCRLSGKPGGQAPVDYYQKIANYVRILGDYARAIDPSATYKNFPVRPRTASESVFCYHDSASSRSGLSAVTNKLQTGKVAIVGLGGTGSYILDLIAKTPVEAVHLFDDDEFLAHNAFRAPGAASLDDVRQRQRKVDYFAAAYSVFRRAIVPHAQRITENSVNALQDMCFVFLAIDAGPTKRMIITKLTEWSIPFVDCGMGLERVDNSLRGTVRTTFGSPGLYEHIERHISFQDITEDEYDFNLQTADLNMLNATLAVIRWKRFMGYYSDRHKELNSLYKVASNTIVNGETAG